MRLRTPASPFPYVSAVLGVSHRTTAPGRKPASGRAGIICTEMPSPVTVLIVEDDADIAALIAHFLEKSGFRSEIVSDGGRALARATESSPDLVILDLMLPGLNGLEICRALRARDETAALPIIMLTARGEESERIF